MPRIFDISEPISERTAVFPGDTPFTREWVARMRDGASCNVSTVRGSVHCGTHADAPLHYDDAGADIASVSLHAYLGRCRVLHVTPVDDPPVVPVAALTRAALFGVERLLLRTHDAHDGDRFDPRFVSLGTAAARVLVDAGIALVGIDTPSMDHATSKDLPTHQILKHGRVALLENLDLSAVPAGDYELIALPLRIVGGDASPVRAILRELA
jgi:arylformamidase